MYLKFILTLAVSFLIFLSGPGLPIKLELVPTADARSLSKVFRQINPAVVVIVTKEHGHSSLKPGETAKKGGLGSGVVVSKDGLVMTASHVVQVADAVSVHFLDGRSVSAKVVGTAMQADVALLRLETVPDNLVVAELGNSDLMAIGDEVFVVGAPYGIDHTLTVGFLSGRRRPIGICNQPIPTEFLQTDAAINVGNSGGPMFSWDGKVIGIVSHILSQSGGSEGLGFAISINSAKELLLNQKSFWIGLETYLVSGPLAKALNVPQEAGLLIQRVADNSPAHEMGLEPSMIPVKIGREKILIGGDIVLEVQGVRLSTKVEDVCQIRDTMGGLHQGGSLEIKVLRGGKILTLSTTK